jgi:hypothetical protein
MTNMKPPKGPDVILIDEVVFADPKLDPLGGFMFVI